MGRGISLGRPVDPASSDRSPKIVTARDLISALAGASAERLAASWTSWTEKPQYRLVRMPETGLVMIRGRTGGGGAPFNLGEATVTRATVRLESGEIGHSYALGRNREKSIQAAVFHALWQREGDRDAVEALVLAPLQAAAAVADRKRRNETAATKVNFFTMVRGDD